MLVACADEVGDVVVDGANSNEPVLVAYLEELRQAAQLAPNSAQVRGELGFAYDANDFFDAAAITYEQAARLDASNFAWPYLQAAALANRGNYAAALAAMDQALRLDPTYASAWLLRGGWLLEFDEHAAAQLAYARATETAQDPATSAAADVGMARALLRQDKPQAAAELLEQLTPAFPHPYIHQVLASAYLRIGKQEQARALLATLDADPPVKMQWPDPISARKMAYVRGFNGQLKIAERMLKNDKAREALAILEDLRSRESDVHRFPDGRRLFNTMTFAYRLMERPDLAESVITEALEAYPDFPQFHFTYAGLLADRGNQAMALEQLDTALRLDPTMLAGYARKFDLLRSARRLEDALAVFEARLPYGNVRAQEYFDAGLVAGTLARWLLAISYFEQALASEPTFARAALFLGHSLASAGDFDAAQAAFANAARLGSDPADVAAATKRLQDLQPGVTE